MTNIGTREAWLAARSDLLEREKDLTRRSDELARERMALPWVPVEQDYSFCTVDGSKPLTDLFGECSQLLVYHLMMAPDWTEACSGCTYTADSFDRAVQHLPHRDVAFVAVSRAPVPAIEAYKATMGWSFRWVSCGASTFNEDMERFGAPECDELHGLSAFARDGDDVFHTYSTFDRGTDVLNSVWQLLDRAPLGRSLEVPRWPRRRYEYAA